MNFSGGRSGEVAGTQKWRVHGRRIVVGVHDLLWIPLSLSLAFLVRFGGYHPGLLAEVRALAQFAIIATVAHTVSLWWRGCYRGLWRYASLPDLVRLAQAVAIGVVLSLAIAFLSGRLQGFPRSILLIYPVILLFGLGAGRLAYRIRKDRSFIWGLKAGPRAIVVGAGLAAELLIRDLRRSHSYVPLALLDDSRAKQGSEIHGVRVVGPLSDLERLIASTKADVVLYAMPSAPPDVLRGIVEVCKRLGVPCRTLPSLAELVTGKVTVASLRAVRVDDLLGRDTVKLGSQKVREWLQGQRVLVTGGGGSIGAELCRQLLRDGAPALMVVDNCEYNLYRILAELEAHWAGRVAGKLVNVTNEKEVARVFSSFRPDYVFHAAAYKHVPLVEANPVAGARVNIYGTKVVGECAARFGASRFVQVSTDKAVLPSNVMGATKRVAELLCEAMNQTSSCSFVVTRFGNVLGSNGSVVPLFRQQLQAGGPLTVTHPEMRRYFMTIEEAASLILEAGASRLQHGTFVLDMGKPIRIRDLAEQMIFLSGLEPEKDIQIVYTGLRPGEKLYEELFYPEERRVGTDHPKLLLAQPNDGLDYQVVLSEIDTLTSSLLGGRHTDLFSSLCRLVPGFSLQVPLASADHGTDTVLPFPTPQAQTQAGA